MICNKVHFKALVPSSKFRTQTTTTVERPLLFEIEVRFSLKSLHGLETELKV